MTLTRTEPTAAEPPLVLWLAGALLGLLAVRLLALHYNATELFFDEAQYWSWSREPAFGYYSKPPLVAWIIRTATEVCGASEFCIRLPSPVLHTLTAVAIFRIGRRLYDATTGLWSAMVFATLPGVSVSAGIISTDVPLLLCWAVALIGLIGLLETRAWTPAIVLGVALGLGLNAKYAMAYFGVCLGLYLLATPAHRGLLRDLRLWAALAIALLLIAPNLAWNAQHSFATFAHTADNAKWGGSLVHPMKAAEFFLAQFGVFGPVLFAALLAIALRAYRQGVPSADRLLLAFSLPIVAIVTAQALISRAHANWAALAYVAATVLVTATLVRDLARRWLEASLALHVAVLALIGVATAQAGRLSLPLVGDPLARQLGWRALALETRRVADGSAAERKVATIITDDRSVTAELLYYLPAGSPSVLAWRGAARPQDHYELTRPFRAGSPEPVLLVALRPDATPITSRFTKVEPLGTRKLPAGAGPQRTVNYFLLSGFRAP